MYPAFCYVVLGTLLDVRVDCQVYVHAKTYRYADPSVDQSGERFEGRSDGEGLYLRFRKEDKTPFWRFRYKLAGKPRTLMIGSYSVIQLAKAREIAKELAARVALGHDMAAENQQRKAEAIAKIEAEKNAVHVSELAAEYYSRQT